MQLIIYVFVAIARFRLLVNFEVLDFMCDIVGIMILNCLCDKVLLTTGLLIAGSATMVAYS